jgi:hypothetical protein
MCIIFVVLASFHMHNFRLTYIREQCIRCVSSQCALDRGSRLRTERLSLIARLTFLAQKPPPLAHMTLVSMALMLKLLTKLKVQPPIISQLI